MAVNWWADPMILGKAPQYLEKVLTQEDLKVICQPLNFFGYNIYFANNYNADAKSPDLGWPGDATYTVRMGDYPRGTFTGLRNSCMNDIIFQF